jgi:hypothetical protein
MKKLKTNYLGIILYALLGLFLGYAEISIVNKPLEFLLIFFVVLGIDLNAAYVMYLNMEDENDKL